MWTPGLVEGDQAERSGDCCSETLQRRLMENSRFGLIRVMNLLDADPPGESSPRLMVTTDAGLDDAMLHGYVNVRKPQLRAWLVEQAYTSKHGGGERRPASCY